MVESPQAVLVLEDGTSYSGLALGKLNHRSYGELVFNTGLTGYQEILTDPSYAGQLVTLTTPEIGNYGFCTADNQARRSFAAALIVRQASTHTSSWRARGGETVDQYLTSQGLSGISGIDTRALTRRLRSSGAMRAVLSTEQHQPNLFELRQSAMDWPSMQGQNLTGQVTTPASYWVEPTSTAGASAKTVVVLDYGLKLNMLSLLSAQGFRLCVVPAQATYADIMALKPAGVFLSNGPGDPEACTEAIETLRSLIALSGLPIFGVCLGHQLLALALGAKTYKLKFGHRGSNHPVIDLARKRTYITSQNHGFAVQEESLAGLPVRVTYQSLNDSTIEGLEHLHKPIFSVQFHPEASPGPQDTQGLFERFAEVIRGQLNFA